MHGWGVWDSSWLWSLALVAITIAIHAAGVVLIGNAIEWIKSNLFRRGLTYLDKAPGTIALMVAVALSLGVFHAIESLLWAIVYVWLGALPSPADAALYSVDSMTTRGASGLQLDRQWRMMGATEAGDGMLLFGISTAFLFYVMQRLWMQRLLKSDFHGTS
jgi:cobalamin biosynthesis protein CobD/CbiB